MKIRWMDGNYFVWQLSYYLEKTLLCEGPLGEVWKKDWKKTEGRFVAPTARGDDKYINPSQDDGIGYSLLTGKCHQPIQDETAFTEQQSGQVITTHSLTH